MRCVVQCLMLSLGGLTALAHAGDEEQRDLVQRVLTAARDVNFKLDEVDPKSKTNLMPV